METITTVLDQILEEVRALQDRISRLEVQNYEREVQGDRREYGRDPLEVTYGRTHSDVRNQAAHVTGYLRLKKARDMIPEFDGTSQAKLKEFLSACAYVIKNISPAEEKTLLEAILCTKLKGKAMTDFETRNIDSFQQLKRELETCYLSKRSTTHLQIEFNSLK